MKISFSLLFFIMLLLSAQAFSAMPEKRNALPQILKLDTKKTEIKFYKDQNGDVADFTLPTGSLTFPMNVLEEQGEYIKVAISGKSVWVESRYFKLNRSCSDLAAQSIADKSSNDLSASRGAGNGQGCSK